MKKEITTFLRFAYDHIRNGSASKQFLYSFRVKNTFVQFEINKRDHFKSFANLQERVYKTFGKYALVSKKYLSKEDLKFLSAFENTDEKIKEIEEKVKEIEEKEIEISKEEACKLLQSLISSRYYWWERGREWEDISVNFFEQNRDGSCYLDTFVPSSEEKAWWTNWGSDSFNKGDEIIENLWDFFYIVRGGKTHSRGEYIDIKKYKVKEK